MNFQQSTYQPEPGASTPLRDALEGLGRRISDLDCCINRLAGRLSDSVLAPSLPQAAGAGHADQKLAAVHRPHSPVLNDLHAASGALEQIAMRINDLHERLEA